MHDRVHVYDLVVSLLVFFQFFCDIMLEGLCQLLGMHDMIGFRCVLLHGLPTSDPISVDPWSILSLECENPQ